MKTYTCFWLHLERSSVNIYLQWWLCLYPASYWFIASLDIWPRRWRQYSRSKDKWISIGLISKDYVLWPKIRSVVCQSSANILDNVVIVKIQCFSSLKETGHILDLSLWVCFLIIFMLPVHWHMAWNCWIIYGQWSGNDFRRRLSWASCVPIYPAVTVQYHHSGNFFDCPSYNTKQNDTFSVKLHNVLWVNAEQWHGKNPEGRKCDALLGTTSLFDWMAWGKLREWSFFRPWLEPEC
jgi:hypothetical protein